MVSFPLLSAVTVKLSLIIPKLASFTLPLIPNIGISLTLGSFLFPLLGLNTLRWHSLNGATLDIVPICAQTRSTALGKALHHGALLLWRRVLVQLLKEEVYVLPFVV